MACATKVMKVIPLISFILSVTNIIIICVAIFKDYNFLFINTNGPKIIAVLLLILMFALFMCELCSFLLYCSFKNMQEICVHVHTTTWKLSCFTKAFLLVALFYLFNYMSPKPWSFVCRVVFLVSGILHLVLILVAEGAAKFSRQQISSPREAEEGPSDEILPPKYEDLESIDGKLPTYEEAMCYEKQALALVSFHEEFI